MLGRPDPKNLEKMMKKLNMNVQEVPAEMVVIKGKDKNIIISKPEIMLANMMGRDIYQITGEVSESFPVKEDDIRMVMEKTGRDRATVEKKLEELSNDLARAIVELKEVEKEEEEKESR
jgi:nascent polypeptide-associated complex subunit alpha